MNQNKKLHPAVVLLLAAVILGGLFYESRAQKQAADPGYEYSWLGWETFDTITEVIGNAESREEWDSQMTAFEADLKAYNRLYDIYNTYEGLTNLASLNQRAGQGPVPVDSRIIDLLELAKEAYALTDGKMNVAAGAVLALWHDARTAGLEDPDHAALPDPAALAEAARHCDINDVIIDRTAGTVELRDPDMRLDVGSIGKGYAVELSARAAEARGLTSASISVGGNIRTIGTRRDGRPWGVGIENPWGSDARMAAALDMPAGASLVTSGSYQRYYTVDGVRYHHIIDLSTLAPAEYFVSVSVLGPDSGLADCLSTGLFCLPLEEGRQIIESLEGYEAFWMESDGAVTYTAGMENYLQK